MSNDLNCLQHFNMWCVKVLPLVFDDSLTSYELLCKVIDYINHLIDDNKIMATEITALQNDISTIQNWIDNFDTSYAEKIIEDKIATMIFVEISESGYIIYNIPQKWENITFNTTGYDINLGLQPNYGHLVLSY